MKKIIYIIMIAIAVVIQSCSEYLEETNPNFLPADTYWKNLDESESNLTSVYGGMLNQFVLGIEEEFFRTDLAHPGQRSAPNGQFIAWYEQRVNFDNKSLENRWSSKYSVIWRANQVIEGLNGMSEELKVQDRWTEQMGQARFFRGLMHFYLHSTFNEGKIIIRDKAPQVFNDFQIPVSTSEEVMEFFRADLEYAYANLPAKFSQKTRVDAGAAATILGTSYLYEGNYAKAIEYFSDVVNNPDYGYQLEQDLNKIFTNAGDFNSESILEINYSDSQQLEDGLFDEESFFHRLARWSAPNGKHQEEKKIVLGGQSLLLPSAWLTYEYMNEQVDTQDPRNYIDGDLNGILRNVSLRSSQSIAVVNDEAAPYYGYNAPQVFAFSGTRFSLYKKYTNHDIEKSEFNTGTSPWRSGRNIVVNRLSGVYLMYAECLTQTGDITGALNYINQIRQRWGLQLLGTSDGSLHDFDEITYTKTSLMERLMYKEYPLELSLEGFSTRFIDLRRWGVTAERFNDLSTEVYSVIDYTYTKTNGKTGVRKQSLLQKGSGPREFTEYIEASNAWSGFDLGYFPLPQNETLNNNNLSE